MLTGIRSQQCVEGSVRSFMRTFPEQGHRERVDTMAWWLVS